MKKSFFIYLVALVIITGIFRYVVWSENKVSETDNQNINKNINVSANININLDTSTWITYDSKNSEDYAFKELRPFFQVSYPKEWTVTETAGGLFLTKDEYIGNEPNLSIGWVDEDLSKNVLEDCKNYFKEIHNIQGAILSFEIEKEVMVDNIKSAYLSYKDNYGFINEKTVCIPLKGKVFFFGGYDNDAAIVINYFDKVLETLKLDLSEGIVIEPKPDCDPKKTYTDEYPPESKWVTYSNEKFGFSFKYPENYKIWEDDNSDQENGNIDLSLRVNDPMSCVTTYIRFGIDVSHRKINDILNEYIPNDYPLDYYLETILIDDYGAKESSYTGCRDIFIEHAEKTFWFHCTSLTPAFEKILATFKFID